MGLEDQQERLKQRLAAAPKRERAPRIASLLRAMRDEIARAADEKNLSYKDIQEMLAADGLSVSISTLSRHLGEKRKGRGLDSAANRKAGETAARPTPPESTRSTSVSGEEGSRRGPTRPIPPMPSPIIRPADQASAGKSDEPTVARASSFPVRRDRDEI